MTVITNVDLGLKTHSKQHDITENYSSKDTSFSRYYIHLVHLAV